MLLAKEIIKGKYYHDLHNQIFKCLDIIPRLNSRTNNFDFTIKWKHISTKTESTVFYYPDKALCLKEVEFPLYDIILEW